MDKLRSLVDGFYLATRRGILWATRKDPEIAHELFIKGANLVHGLGIERLLLDCHENQMNPGFEISNAAGFNKNGSIPPTFLKYLGFDRVVVGTVTAEPYVGNPRPRIKTYPTTESAVNWMKLPGLGAGRVAENLYRHGNHKVPITINLMATPDVGREDIFKDLESTVLSTKRLHGVDRYELNISCPNTDDFSRKKSSRIEYAQQLRDMVLAVSCKKFSNQELWLKVSPDIDQNGVAELMDYLDGSPKISGFVISNTTTYHDPEFITILPNQDGMGGASGNAVYERAKAAQGLFYSEITRQNLPYKIIACGGINSQNRVRERTMNNDRIIRGIQLFTPLVFKGPGLLRELRSMKF